MGDGRITNGTFTMMMDRANGNVRVRFVGSMQNGLNEFDQHISSITGTMTCGRMSSNFFITRWNPNVKPSQMPWGTEQYYRFRHEDFRRRHPELVPPDYYLSYGARYVRVLTADIRRSLSPRGVRFVDDVGVRLQQMMDSLIISDPAGFDSLETSGSVADFAFRTHVQAYCAAGWGNLPEQDRDLIVRSIDFRDKWLRYAPLMTSFRILRACGYLQDGVPDWDWLPEWEEMERRILEILGSSSPAESWSPKHLGRRSGVRGVSAGVEKAFREGSVDRTGYGEPAVLRDAWARERRGLDIRFSASRGAPPRLRPVHP